MMKMITKCIYIDFMYINDENDYKMLRFTFNVKCQPQVMLKQ